MKDDWGDIKYHPLVCNTVDKELLEQKEKQEKAPLARSRDGAQVEGRTEEGESMAMALDNKQVHDPNRDDADLVDSDSFRLNALLVSGAADECKSDTRQPSLATMPLEAEAPTDGHEAAWFSKATFG